MTMSDSLGTALSGRYVIEQELGRGGMATVFLARDLRHGRAVARRLKH
jgi:eukaryotic-like serine/threonine-protein kinase